MTVTTDGYETIMSELRWAYPLLSMISLLSFLDIFLMYISSARHKFLNPHGYPGMGVASTGTSRDAHTRDI